jgi:hypothetical protein
MLQSARIIMPSLEWNKRAWDGEYDWENLGGNNWSTAWGDSESQWFASLYPRIHNFLPAATILEIAPGAGRWTQFLINHCDKFIAVDYSQQCVDVCRQRFAPFAHAEFHANDGRSLQSVPDKSIDFAFSFDSLVHVECDVIESYVQQLGSKLAPHAVAFIHHSNLGSYPWLPATDSLSDKRFVWRLRDRAVTHGLWPSMHARARSVSAQLFETYCQRSGLRCIGQEKINWDNTGLGAKFLIDCLSIVTPVNSKWSRVNRVVENHAFVHEARSISMQSKLYSAESFRSAKSSA